MTEKQVGAAALIASGATVLGIELGSTRIKASLIAPDATPLASGSHTWENRLEDGVWTYSVAEVERGLAAAYASLVADVRARHGVDLRGVAAMGVSAMMHGYVALDDQGELLVPFRTWRNNITGAASGLLTQALDFPVPQRWSVAHLYQSILEDQPHLPRLAHLTTLAGYVHWRLTGERVLGVGDASGMFPIDAAEADWDAARLAAFDALVGPRGLPWTLRGVIPSVLRAGRPAGRLSTEGARLLDTTDTLRAGVPLCPPEGDAGTGMVATNAVRARSRASGSAPARPTAAPWPWRTRTTGRRTSTPGWASSGRSPARSGIRQTRTNSTGASCRWPSRGTPMRVASSRSTTSRASTRPVSRRAGPYSRAGPTARSRSRTSSGRCSSPRSAQCAAASTS